MPRRVIYAWTIVLGIAGMTLGGDVSGVQASNATTKPAYGYYGRMAPEKARPLLKYGMIRTLSWPGNWDDGFICFAEVHKVKSADNRAVPGFVRLKVQEGFVHGAAPVELILPPGSLMQVMVQERLSFRQVAGDLILLRCPINMRRPFPLHAISIDKKDREQWATSLRLIQAFHQAKGPKARAKAGETILNAKTDLCVLYMGRLLKEGKHEVPDSWKPLLLKARDNEKLFLWTRLLMSLAMHRHEPKYCEEKGHIKWVREWFAKPADLRFDEWRMLLNQIRRYPDIKEIEQIDLPRMMALLRSPKTDGRQKGAILNWIDSAFSNYPDINEKVAKFLLKEALNQPQRRAARSFLSAAASCMSNVTRRQLRGSRSREDVEKGVEKLREHVTILTEMLDKPKAARHRTYIRFLISNRKKDIARYSDKLKNKDRPSGKRE